ncbi:MAG TPA: putative lipid II flippase FtsW [Acidimicrobiia bacterium]|nr:putative lipid II flippase FtsW [Acidimicrobiia bacterium]
MTTKVTSIARVRTAARRREETTAVNSRLIVVLGSVVLVLLVIGIGELMSASSIRGITDASDRFFYLKRQLVGLGIGFAVLLVLVRVPYQSFRRIAYPVFFVSLAGLIAVFATGITRNGSQRWLDLGFVTFQPSEVSKLAVIIALATIFERKGNLLFDRRHFFAPIGLIVGSTALLIMLQPDLGTTLVVAASAMSVILVSRAPLRYVALLGAGSVAASLVLAVTESYRADRITSFLNPWADPNGTGYQVIQGFYALGTGGLFGVGLGASRSRWSILPNAHTDFIFAIIGEETGLVGALGVVALCLFIALCGWSIAARAPDRFGRMLAAGITGWLSFQALANIGGVLGVLPITGIVLPFVSYGATALITSLGAVGILINIARQGNTRPRL